MAKFKKDQIVAATTAISFGSSKIPRNAVGKVIKVTGILGSKCVVCWSIPSHNNPEIEVPSSHLRGVYKF